MPKIAIGEERSFTETLNNFLKYSGETPHAVSNMNLEELRKVAFRMLVNQAKKIVMFDRTDNNVPIVLRKEDKQELMEDFRGKIFYCQLLKLAGMNYTKYFDQATRELDEELEYQRKQQPQEV